MSVVSGPNGRPLPAPVLNRWARSMLLGGQVQVLSADAGNLRAEVFDHPRGSTRTERFVVTFSDGHWWCTCSRAGRCGHQLAVQAVSPFPASGRPIAPEPGDDGGDAA